MSIFCCLAQMRVNVWWLKRDFRIHDHEGLHWLIEQGLPVLVVYFFEPKMMEAPDSSARHWSFVWESIEDLDQTLKAHHHQNDRCIQIAHCAVEEGFTHIAQEFELAQVVSYEETGNLLSYRRDLAMQTWFKDRGIVWKEFQTNGVQRALKNTRDWVSQFEGQMKAPLWQPNIKALQIPEVSNCLSQKLLNTPLPAAVNQVQSTFQKGGETMAWKYLKSFFDGRVAHYNRGISKPELSRKTCSRLSPYLAWGCVSLRAVFHEAADCLQQKPYTRELKSFESRLYWRSHFIQKFEMEHRYEYENINRGFDALNLELREDWLEAWESGTTGYPLVDACMRCLKATGYINFRMRAMLVSFLTHNLIQPWASGAHFLARQFLDYEPGIHYPQMQMQAGTTGTNTFRIYNVVKQAIDQDPQADFIKKWIPELRHLPSKFALVPWELTPLDFSMYSIDSSSTYPKPIVNAEQNARLSKQKLGAVMKSNRAQADAKRILSQHVHLNDQLAQRSEADKILKARLRHDA